MYDQTSFNMAVANDGELSPQAMALAFVMNQFFYKSGKAFATQDGYAAMINRKDRGAGARAVNELEAAGYLTNRKHMGGRSIHFDMVVPANRPVKRETKEIDNHTPEYKEQMARSLTEATITEPAPKPQVVEEPAPTVVEPLDTFWDDVPIAKKTFPVSNFTQPAPYVSPPKLIEPELVTAPVEAEPLVARPTTRSKRRSFAEA